MEETPRPEWWIDEYVRVSAPIEDEMENYKSRVGVDYCGSGHKFVNEYLRENIQSMEISEFAEKVGSGAYLLETIPFVLFVLAKYSHNPEEALVKAVSYSKDSDTIGAIVGSALGALHGIEAFPDRWIRNLTGRLSYRDDGRVFKLIDRCCNSFL